MVSLTHPIFILTINRRKIMQTSLFKEDKYSVAIYPPLEIMHEVAAMKTRLAMSIGWFNSRNSKAHISICEFMGDQEKEVSIRRQLYKMCTPESPLELCFDHFGSYANGAFCLFPNEKSKEDLKHLMKRIQEQLETRILHKSDSPHMSIARRLDENKLIIANQLFKDNTMNFLCDRLVLRVFDTGKRQYRVIDEFLFQGSLFKKSM